MPLRRVAPIDLEPAPAVLPTALRPATGIAVQRLGGGRDGGYVVAAGRALSAVEWIVGLGLGDDWRFERDLQAVTGAPVDIYDHTVNRRYWLTQEPEAAVRRTVPFLLARSPHLNPQGGYRRYRQFFGQPGRRHHRQEVGDTAGTTSVTSILGQHPGREVFLKVDIEGAEWRVLPDILAERGRIVGLAMEFHDVDLLLPRLVEFAAGLTGFTLVNTHANNFGRVAPDGTPTVVEVSWARTELCTAAQPGDLAWQAANAPNSSLARDIALQFAD